MTSNLIKNKRSNCKVYIKHFSDAKTDCMIDYSKPSFRHDPDHVISHVETNDLKSEKTPKCIKESITDLAVSQKNEKHYVSISNLIKRTDN